MTETGTVAKLIGDKPFGFIRRPDGSELFFHFSKYHKGEKPAVGDELNYEVGTDSSKPAGKQTFADRIKVVKKGSGSAPAPATTPATPAPAMAALPSPLPAATPILAPTPLPEPLDYTVQLMFSEPRKSDYRFELDAAAFITDSNSQPVRNALLTISTQYGVAMDGLNTDLNGSAPFTVVVTAPFDEKKNEYKEKVNVPSLNVVVSVFHGGKALSVAELWPEPKLKAQKPIKRPAAPKLPPATTTPATPVAADPALTSPVSAAPDGAKVIDITPVAATSTPLPAASTPPDPAAPAADPADSTTSATVASAPPSPMPVPTVPGGTTPDFIEVERLGQNGNVYTFKVRTKPNALVSVESLLEIKASATGVDWKEGHKVSLTSDDNGNLELQTQMTKPGTKGDVFFVSGSAKTPVGWYVVARGEKKVEEKKK